MPLKMNDISVFFIFISIQINISCNYKLFMQLCHFYKMSQKITTFIIAKMVDLDKSCKCMGWNGQGSLFYLSFQWNRTLLEILSFAIYPCATTCNQMLPMTINGCLCNYFSNLDEVWSSFQLCCDYDLFHS